MEDLGQLIQAVRDYCGGQKAAFDLIYEKTHAQTAAVIRKLVSQQEDQADLLLKTYLRVAGSLNQLHEPEKVQNFINTTAKRLCVDFYRSRSRKMDAEELRDDKQEDDSTIQEESLVAADITPEASAIINSSCGEFKKLFELLPEKQQRILWMLFGLDMNRTEAAQVMGVSAETVRSNERVSLQKLKDMLEELKKCGVLPVIAPINMLLRLFFTKSLDSETVMLSSDPDFQRASAKTLANIHKIAASSSSGGIGAAAKAEIAAATAAAVIGVTAAAGVLPVSMFTEKTTAAAEADETAADADTEVSDNISQLPDPEETVVIAPEDTFQIKGESDSVKRSDNSVKYRIQTKILRTNETSYPDLANAFQQMNGSVRQYIEHLKSEYPDGTDGAVENLEYHLHYWPYRIDNQYISLDRYTHVYNKIYNEQSRKIISRQVNHYHAFFTFSPDKGRIYYNDMFQDSSVVIPVVRETIRKYYPDEWEEEAWKTFDLDAAFADMDAPYDKIEKVSSGQWVLDYEGVWFKFTNTDGDRHSVKIYYRDHPEIFKLPIGRAPASYVDYHCPWDNTRSDLNGDGVIDTLNITANDNNQYYDLDTIRVTMNGKSAEVKLSSIYDCSDTYGEYEYGGDAIIHHGSQTFFMYCLAHYPYCETPVFDLTDGTPVYKGFSYSPVADDLESIRDPDRFKGAVLTDETNDIWDEGEFTIDENGMFVKLP